MATKKKLKPYTTKRFQKTFIGSGIMSEKLKLTSAVLQNLQAREVDGIKASYDECMEFLDRFGCLEPEWIHTFNVIIRAMRRRKATEEKKAKESN